MTTFFETTRGGFRVLGLRSAEVELQCAPDLGGRVFSLVSRRTGREWLWRQPGDRELFRPADPLDFGTGCFAGLDECLPTIGACAWPDGRRLADHGDIWARPWQVESHQGSTLALTAVMAAYPLSLRRTICVEGKVVRFDYALENHGAAVAPALWAMHPLFTLVPGDRLELPGEVRELRVESLQPALPPTGEAQMRPAIAFPEPMPGVRLDALELPDLHHGYLKCFTAALSVNSARAALANPATGDRLEVHWDAATAPYLGLWLTRGGYRGWHHVALEPTNAPHDRADIAAANPALAPAILLPPHTSRHWWVEWRLS